MNLLYLNTISSNDYFDLIDQIDRLKENYYLRWEDLKKFGNLTEKFEKNIQELSIENKENKEISNNINDSILDLSKKIENLELSNIELKQKLENLEKLQAKILNKLNEEPTAKH